MPVFIISLYLLSVGWPFTPQDSMHVMGNGYGLFEEIGSVICLHEDVDIVLDTSGVPIYAVADGYVKTWLNAGGVTYWGLLIGDEYGTDSCDGWIYWHIDSSKYHVNLGDTCSVGELIGYVVPWFYTGQPVRFHHLHFGRIRSGGYPWYSVLHIQNVLALLTPYIDTIKPMFEDAHATGRFAFCRDNTSEYLNPDSLTGDVDIIALIHDKTGYSTPWPEWDRLIPYKIEYRMHGPDTIPTTRMMEFSGLLNWDSLFAVTIYKNDVVCNSCGPYVQRDFYYIVTNTDGDTLIEPSDTLGCWQTESYQDGTYWVVVTASDICGNTASDSMQVTLQNETGVNEWFNIKEMRTRGYIHPTIFHGSLLMPENMNCKILDITGRVVVPERIKPGIYFIEIDGKITQKIIKIK